MRTIFLPFIVFLAFFVEAQESIYLCPMHPHIVGEHGQSCPICGMDLVPKQRVIEPAHSAISDTPQSFTITPEYQQALGSKTAQVSHRKMGEHFRAYGHIQPNMRFEQVVAVRSAGWIVDLPFGAVGDVVKPGDLLFTYYSPALMSAQSDYLLGQSRRVAEQRLRNLGMGSQAIKALVGEGKYLEATPFYASVAGTITELNARSGSYLKTGDTAMRLHDLTKLWIIAELPMHQAHAIREGMSATVQLLSGQSLPAQVTLVEPIANALARTIPVRLVVDNTQGFLRPNQYVDVLLHADVQSRLVVPIAAVRYEAQGTYVMESLGEGRFRSVKVKIGLVSEGWAEVLEGLRHSQEVVTSGQFMLDAESQLRNVFRVEQSSTKQLSEHVKPAATSAPAGKPPVAQPMMEHRHGHH